MIRTLVALLLFAQYVPSGGRFPSGVLPAPTIRGTGLLYFYGATQDITWPSGTVAGDFAVIELGGNNNLSSTPTGWTLNNSSNGVGGTGGGSVISKVLNSSDISAGKVTLTLSGAFTNIAGITTFVGATGGIREVDGANTGGSNTLTTSGSVGVHDAGIYFGMAYAVSNNPSTYSINKGTPNPASVTDSFYMSGSQYQDVRLTGGSFSVTFTPSASLIGGYNAIVIVKP